jgi:hypothetical protein
MHIHYEGEARKTPNDVCSFFLHYFENCVPINQRILFHLVIEKNKNHTVVRFLVSLCD